MAPKPVPAAWISLVSLTMMAILWNCLIITACVPPLAGNASILSDFHLMELRQGSRAVRFGYIAYCTMGDSGGKATWICNTLDDAMRPSPQTIASKLPNVDPLIFNLAFLLNRTAFPILPAASLAFLVLTAILLVAHWVVREKAPSPKAQQVDYSSPQKKPSDPVQTIMLAVLGCTGVGLMLSLAAAVSVTLTTAAVANVTTISNIGFVASRGETAYRFHWLAFATTLLVMLSCAVILPRTHRRTGNGADGVGGGGVGGVGGGSLGGDGPFGQAPPPYD